MPRCPMLHSSSKPLTIISSACSCLLVKPPYSPCSSTRFFGRCLRSEDSFIALKASKILTTLLCASPKPNTEAAGELFRWTTAQLQSKNPAEVDLSVQVLESALRQRSVRIVYWNTPQAVDALVRILKMENPGPQMQYQVIYCFWILTFNEEIAQELNRYFSGVLLFEGS